MKCAYEYILTRVGLRGDILYMYCIIVYYIGITNLCKYQYKIENMNFKGVKDFLKNFNFRAFGWLIFSISLNIPESAVCFFTHHS